MAASGTLLLFGRLKDAFGTDRLDIPDGVVTAADLRARLADQNPDLAEMLLAPSIRIAINQELVADEQNASLMSGDEVALLPPLSGG